MKTLRALALIGLSLIGFPAAAQETIHVHRDWRVTVDSFDDGSLYCRAEVHQRDAIFAVVTHQWATPMLHLFLPDIWVGESVMDFSVQIDGRRPWNLYDATTQENSIFFELGDARARDFIAELWQGRNLYLLNDAGQRVYAISLAGSASSLGALAQCTDYIRY